MVYIEFYDKNAVEYEKRTNWIWQQNIRTEIMPKKALVTASLGNAAEYLRQRAKELDITVIEEKDPEKIKRLLKDAYQSLWR